MRRWSPLSGIVFVVLFVVAAALLGETGETPQEVQEYYLENDTRIFAAFFILLASALSFLWFAGTLKDALSRPGVDGPLASVGYGAGVVTSAMLVVGAAMFAAPAEIGDDAESGIQLDPAAADIFDTSSYFLLTGGIAISSLLVLATSVIGLRTGAVPRWLALVGFVVAPVVFFAPFFLPVLAFFLWVIAVSIVLLMSGRRAEPAPVV